MKFIEKIKRKNNFYIKKIKNILDIIKKNLICEININIESNIGINVKINNKKIDNIEFLNKDLIKITIFKNFKKSIFLCNNLNIKNIISKIKYILYNHNYTKQDKHYYLPKIKKYNNKKQNLGLIFNEKITYQQILELLINTEQNALNTNKLIISDNTELNYIISNKIIANNNIIKNYFTSNFILINSIIANKINDMEHHYNYINTHKWSDLISKSHYIGKKTAKEVISKLNKGKIKTKKYKILFRKQSLNEIFLYLIKLINGKNIYNKTSYMKNKLKKKILPKWINIIEDPFIYKGLGSKPFDNDGINVKKYFIVKNGTLQTWITNYFISKKLNISNTVNSGGIHNWIFINKKKKISIKLAIKKIKNGLIIENFLGNGVNLSTGYFSLGASGYLIKNKKIKFYIDKITISGKLQNLFKNIKYMCNDINIDSNIRAGSIIVSNIQITSKN